MARLLPKRSQLKVPLYIDDGETYKKSGHWKRIKFKQNNYVQDSRDWVPMDLEGNIIGKEIILILRLSKKTLTRFQTSSEIILMLWKILVLVIILISQIFKTS